MEATGGMYRTVAESGMCNCSHEFHDSFQLSFEWPQYSALACVSRCGVRIRIPGRSSAGESQARTRPTKPSQSHIPTSRLSTTRTTRVPLSSLSIMASSVNSYSPSRMHVRCCPSRRVPRIYRPNVADWPDRLVPHPPHSPAILTVTPTNHRLWADASTTPSRSAA